MIAVSYRINLLLWKSLLETCSFFLFLPTLKPLTPGNYWSFYLMVLPFPEYYRPGLSYVSFSGWCLSFINMHYVCCAYSLSCVWLFVTHGLWPVRLIWPWECSRQEYWNGLPCPPLGNLPNPRIQPRPPAWQPDSLPSESPGKHKVVVLNHPQLCEVKVAQSCPTLWDTMDYTVQARILEWVAFPFSRDLPDLRIEPRSPAFSSVQSLSRVWLFATPWTPARHASLSITNSWTLPKLMSIESVMPSNHLILCRPLLLLHSIFPRIRLFSNESALHIRWPKYWSFSFNISPPMDTQDWSPLGWTGWISLQSNGLSRVFSNITVQKH